MHLLHLLPLLTTATALNNCGNFFGVWEFWNGVNNPTAQGFTGNVYDYSLPTADGSNITDTCTIEQSGLQPHTVILTCTEGYSSTFTYLDDGLKAYVTYTAPYGSFSAVTDQQPSENSPDDVYYSVNLGSQC